MEKLIVFLSLVTLTLGNLIYKTPICMQLEEPLTMTANGYKRIILHGQITGDAVRETWLNINLVDGDEKVCLDPMNRHLTTNMLLHMVPRVGEDHVVRNTWVKDTNVCIGACSTGWGPEETTGGFPFAIRKWFTIVILCVDNSFQIFIDGNFFASYNYRIPLERVTHLIIVGQGAFKKIDIVYPGSPKDVLTFQNSPNIEL